MKTIAWTLAIAAFLMFVVPIIAHLCWDFEYALAEYATFVGGTAGPMAALAGFFFIYLTFRHQQEQLDRHDEQFERQLFENTFFNLFNYYKTEISNATIGTDHGLMTIQHFKAYLHDYTSYFQHQLEESQEYENGEFVVPKIPEEDLKKYIHGRFQGGQYQIKTIFKPLLSILLVIKDANIKGKDKYYDILESQVSETEKPVLFYLYVVCRPALYTAREYNLIKDFVARMSPTSLIYNEHMDWLNHPPYIRAGTDI